MTSTTGGAWRVARGDERGSALVISLLVMAALSVVASSLMLLSISETFGSQNYKLMTQARYSAESGIAKAAHYLTNVYGIPGGAGDPLAGYDMSGSPVRNAANGQPVVLSAAASVASNYPVAATQTAFLNAASGTLTVGTTTVNYAASAALLSMRQVDVYGTATPVTIQTWRITATGSTIGARTATVEVSAVLERQMITINSYGVFAMGATCGALTFSGGATVDSYDSHNLTYSGGSIVTQQWGGNVGSNGNLNESGNGTAIYGTMSTPRTGVGNCSSNGVDAWTENGHASVTGGLVQLPQVVNYPTPAAPNPMPPTTSLNLTQNSDCVGITGCTISPTSGVALAPGSYGNVNVTGQGVLHLSAGTYTLNSLTLAGNSTIIADSSPIAINIGGTGVTNPVDLTGGTLVNATLDPVAFQILYAGTGGVKVAGGAQSSGLIYAPNAPVSLSGGSHWYGAVVAQTVNASGGMQIHNDRYLSNEYFTVGNFMLSAFTWKKF